MAITEIDWKGANTNTLASALTGLTTNQTLVIVTSWAASSTPPSLDANFTNLGTLNVGSTIAGRIGYRRATGTTDSGGTWTNGTTTMGIAYNGAANPIGFTSNSGTSTTPTFPAMTLSTIANTSWVYCVAVDLSATIQNNAMTGYTVRDTSTNGVVGSWDSNGGLTSNPVSRTISPGASGTWITFQVEIPVPPISHLYNRAIPRASLF